MLVDLLKIRTSDKVVLHGFLVKPKKPKGVIINLHGLRGNFYRAKRLWLMAKEYPKAGWAFLSINSRGHDTGMGTEKFTDCVKDVTAIVNFARRSGFKRIILQGHSTGANKIVYALSKKRLPVSGVALVSGLSDPEMFQAKSRATYKRLIATAKKMIKQGKGKEYLLESHEGAISATRLLSLFEFGSAEDVFSLRLGKRAKRKFRGLIMPTLVAYGTADQFAQYDVKKIGAFVAKQIPGPVTEVYIKGADHGFRGKERLLISDILKWVDSRERGVI